jgi:hypothetical protein
MSTTSLREQLQKQLDLLPDDILNEIADFTAFILARRQATGVYREWTDAQWHEFTLGQLVRETGEDVEYTLDDAEEVFSS